ncbi:hypothetical protein [Thiocystis violascens]|uniref:Uncharacterized protein n=1 Tax=Thiocystis violascens (strain ATCC 17096 / DSM 198 / 6111) TaxID=765911 RepID=I3YHD8_THIV6|nr:hypothetical protein [Thiocystis violascens]AFL76406.1 hypothetical protein Thivi_4615 [Thiocystis violascens DSM 198]
MNTLPHIDPALIVACRLEDPDDFAASNTMVRAAVSALGDDPRKIENWNVGLRDTLTIIGVDLGDGMIDAYCVISDTGQVCDINRYLMSDIVIPLRPSLSVICGGVV